MTILNISGLVLFVIGIIFLAWNILRKHGIERTLELRAYCGALWFIGFVTIFIGVVMLLTWGFEHLHFNVSWWVTAPIISFELLLDWGTTILMLKAGLGIREGNPIHVFFMRYFGFVGDFVFLVTFIGLLLWFIWRDTEASGQVAVCVAYLLVYVNNVLVTRRKLKEKERAERYCTLCLEG
jgi:hypothetical protein